MLNIDIDMRGLDFPVPDNLPVRRPKQKTWFDIGDLLEAGRLPISLVPWQAKKGSMNAQEHHGRNILCDASSIAGMHLVNDDGFGGYTVMSDDTRELRRHLQAVKHAKGKVLKTGLGFGCFARMCLLNPNVHHIDIIEKDTEIAKHFGAQFKGNPRVTIHVADAFDFPIEGQRWDFAWHDIYCDGNDGLQVLHAKLIERFASVTNLQGAWMLERWVRRALNRPFKVI